MKKGNRIKADRRLLESLPNPTCIVAPSGKIIEFNHVFSEAVQRSTEELNHSDLKEVLPIRGGSPSAILQANKSFITKIAIGTGKYSWWVWRTTKIGKNILFVGTDVTQAHRYRIHAKKKVDDTLLELQKSFRDLAEAIPQIVWKTDATGRATYRNGLWYSYTGLSTIDDQGQDVWKKLVHPEEYDRSLELWQISLRTGVPFEMEYRIKSAADQEYHWFLSRAVPIRNSRGKIVKWFGTLTDIDQIKTIQDELKNSLSKIESSLSERSILIAREKAAVGMAKTKSDFLALMSHEIRTPLNGIVMLTQLLQDSPLGDREKEFVNTLKQSTDTLAVIVNDVLDYSKIEAGKLNISTSSFNLKSSVETLVQSAKILAKNKGIDFEFSSNLMERRQYIGDSVRIQQILNNLITNAIKFTEVGKVRLSVKESQISPTDSLIVLEVTDTGVGIDPSLNSLLFQPFVQSDANVHKRLGGTGLGLSIVKRLVDLMGGKISYQSVTGEGTQFQISIILSIDLSQTARAPIDTVATVAKSSARILVAEDHPINRKIIREVLREIGFSVDVADDGEQAIDQWLKGEYDVILMDYHMPKKNGFDATSEIRRIEKESNRPVTPIYALTADITPETSERCRAAGMNGFFAKPLRTNQLLLKLSEHFQVNFTKPARPTLEPLDLDALEHLAKLNSDQTDDFVKEVISDFLVDTPKRISEIIKSYEAGTYDEVKKQAHALKSAAALVGARKLSKVCFELESKSTSRFADSLRPSLNELENAFQEAAHAFKTRYHRAS